MARPKGGLGKGLDSLFADLPSSAADDAAVTALPVREIEPDPSQPRKTFDETALAELAQSIAENGLLQPVAVRPRKTGPGYILIAGERRWRAARLAGLHEIPVLIRDVNDEQAAALALIENLQREDLDPIEEASGIQKLVETYGLTQETTAKRLGKSRSAIANSLRLLALPEAVRDQLRAGQLSAGHAKALLGLADADQMTKAAAVIAERGLNVRQTEALCRKLVKEGGKKRSGKTVSDDALDAFLRPALAVETEAALRQITGSEVHVDYKEGRGTLRIDFYSDAMLKKLAALLGQYDPET